MFIFYKNVVQTHKNMKNGCQIGIFSTKKKQSNLHIYVPYAQYILYARLQGTPC